MKFGVINLVICLMVVELGGATYRVSSISGFNQLNLEGGDEVIWEDGDYYENGTIQFYASGTEGESIRLRSETPGGVKFRGDVRLFIGGDYLEVEGIQFLESGGLSSVVEFRRSGSQTQFGRHSVLRDVVFDNLQTVGDNKSAWIVLYGENNRVENCSLLNKDSTGEGILVEVRYQGVNPAGHVIRRNYFSNFSRKDGRTNSNDSEVIRIGVSSFQTVNAGVLVEENYFVETNGENEIISNKSRNNIFRGNTFRRSRGGLVMRHGSGALVEHNFFLGEGAVDSGGIRISDQDHVIINNYLEGLRGTKWNAGITWVAGDTSSGGTSSGYQYVNNVVVAFNTLVDCTQSIYMNDRGSRAPTNSYLGNNIVFSNRGELIQGDESVSLSGIELENNLMAGASVGFSSAGIINQSPDLVEVEGLYRPSGISPAIDAASDTYPEILKDLEGRSRPLTGRDIGAIEVTGSAGDRIYRPFTSDDVGVLVGSSYLVDTNDGDGFWRGFPIISEEEGILQVDTGDLIGIISVSGDWGFCHQYGRWLYLPDLVFNEMRQWVFMPLTGE